MRRCMRRHTEKVARFVRRSSDEPITYQFLVTDIGLDCPHVRVRMRKLHFPVLAAERALVALRRETHLTPYSVEYMRKEYM